jgi:D-tyrosyl-tRNA(Tyr) deacylase
VRAVVQRVLEASVATEDEVARHIGAGLLVLLGVGDGDTNQDAESLAKRVAHLRIFPDDAGQMNRSCVEVGGEVLVVSQFTLYGDCRRGRRPSYTEAAAPEVAEPLYREFVEQLSLAGVDVEEGYFRTTMDVGLVNHGPVTLLLDSRKTF